LGGVSVMHIPERNGRAVRTMGGERPLVMLVDDDPAIGEMYGVGLEANGFRVSVLNDVSAIFLALEHEIPDAVVLDFQLGGIITGVDVLENLRLDLRTTHVAAFMLSNHRGDLDGQFERALAAGSHAWLAKTQTSPGELALRISEVLASKVGDGSQEPNRESLTDEREIRRPERSGRPVNDLRRGAAGQGQRRHGRRNVVRQFKR
jgi:DNA-binding response OmpR family regulator